MGRQIPLGVLVERAAIHKAQTGRTPHEDFRLYSSGAPCAVCFFSFSDLVLARRSVHAYVYDSRGRLVRRRIALPEVIHYRTVARSDCDRRATTVLVHLRGQRLYNPPHIPGKLSHCYWLRAEPELHDRVPETIHYTGAKSLGLLLSHHPSVVLKRNWGSLGIGILRVRHSAGGFIWEAGTGPRHHCAGLATVASGVRSRIADHQYLVQQSLQLARYRGRSFDLRCVVQRDGTGAWRFVGACLRLSGRNRIATNVARGGRALRPMPILRAVFGEEALGKYADLQHFSVQIAAAVGPLSGELPPADEVWLFAASAEADRFSCYGGGGGGGAGDGQSSRGILRASLLQS